MAFPVKTKGGGTSREPVKFSPHAKKSAHTFGAKQPSHSGLHAPGKKSGFPAKHTFPAKKSLGAAALNGLKHAIGGPKPAAGQPANPPQYGLNNPFGNTSGSDPGSC